VATATRAGISRALGLAAAFACGGLLLSLLWHRALDHWLGSVELRRAVDAIESAIVAAVAALVLYLALRSRERALHRSEQNYRMLFERNLAGVYRTTPDGRILDCNEALAHMLGYQSRQGLLAISVWDTYPDRAERATFLETLRRQGACGSYEHRLLRRDGSTIWVLDAATLLAAERGGDEVIEGTLIEVTERKVREDALRTEKDLIAQLLTEQEAAGERLRASEARYRDLYENTPAMLHSIGPDGRLRSVSQRWLATLGYSREEVIGRLFTDFLTEASLRLAQEVVLPEFMRTGACQDVPSEFVRKDGHVLATLLSAVAERDPQGGVLRSLAVITDVSEQKRAAVEQQRLQEAVRRAAEEWAATFDALQSGVLVLDDQGRVVRLNRSARDLFGRSYQECLGRELSELGAGEPWSTAGGLLATARSQGGGSGQAEDRVGGRWWDVAVSRAGETDRTILVVRNVSRLRELEASVQRAETMAAMGALTAGVAHEVRNPLFAVMANVDAMGAVLGENTEVADLLAAVRRQVGRLADLMVGLLEYGKPAPPIVQQGELLDVLEAAVSSQLPRAEAAGVDLHLKPSGESFPVRMDADRLLRAFENLVANAILHSPRAGQVTLDAGRFEDDGAPWIRCWVTDAGPGFQPQDLPRVFEPFFTKRRGGTGLGLSIAQKIVSDHGGRIRAGNRPEGGAELVVELPGCNA
jgi:PAS domain S-box-containing protein